MKNLYKLIESKERKNQIRKSLSRILRIISSKKVE